MAKVVWLNEAIGQVDLIVAYIELFDPPAAQRIAARLFAVGESLADFPNRGMSGSRGRHEMTTVPPYVLRYEVRDEW